MPELTLDETMGRLADGDRAAFTPAFHLLWPPTLRLCVQALGNEADGADAAQAAMIRILERASEYDRTRPALPWALTIATWECKTLRKRQRRRREAPEEPVRSDGGAAVEEQERHLLTGPALAALATLSPGDQETLRATYWETEASVSGATLRQRRSRALTRLKDAFRSLYGLD
jgi:RNA polymerase sigma-70 factor (ECF subfamily)